MSNLSFRFKCKVPKFLLGIQELSHPSLIILHWGGSCPILDKEYLIGNETNYIEINKIVKLIVYFI